MAVAKSLDKILFQDTDEHGNHGFLRENGKESVLSVYQESYILVLQ